MFGLEFRAMQGSDEIEGKLRELILGQEDICASADLEAIFKAQYERDRRIDETLEDLLDEVDRLLLRFDDLEENEQCNR